MDSKNKPTIENDLTDKLSDDMKKHLLVSQRCSSVKVFSRPKLQATKSFPPYSQCIGGIGQDAEFDSELPSPSEQQQDHPNDEEAKSVELMARCTSSSSVKAKWRKRGKDRLGGSFETCPDDMERRKYLRKRRNAKLVEEVLNGEVDAPKDDGVAVEKDLSRESEDSVEILGDTSSKWSSSPHPLLSKLLHSSTSSSCSSVCASSGESDEAVSEGEHAAVEKRKILKKSRSWKTFLPMMYWSFKRQSSWVQLAGHQGNFQLGEGGEVLKLYSEVEATCLDSLMKDPLRPFVPQFHGLVTRGEHCYLRLEDLLRGLRRPVIMDCKMGVRTYQEEEVISAQTKPTLRSDMFQKMFKVDPSALSPEERAQKAVTKWRYLRWRDNTSSTSTLGFRIEGIMTEDGNVQRDFRKTVTLAQVTETLLFFTRNQLNILKAYHSRLLALGDALRSSPFFRTHEVIGSSLLFVHDHSSKATVWMIDFGKTTPVPDTSELKHNVPWSEGSREDGYLLGLASLMTSLSQAITIASWQQEEDNCGEETLHNAS